jgi:hypothetical protein
MIEQPYMNELEKSQTASNTYTRMDEPPAVVKQRKKWKVRGHTHLITSSVDVDVDRFDRSFSRIS